MVCYRIFLDLSNKNPHSTPDWRIGETLFVCPNIPLLRQIALIATRTTWSHKKPPRFHEEVMLFILLLLPLGNYFCCQQTTKDEIRRLGCLICGLDDPASVILVLEGIEPASEIRGGLFVVVTDDVRFCS